MTNYDAQEVVRIHQELRERLPRDPASRVEALEKILTEKGLVDPQSIDAWVEAYQDHIGPKRGACLLYTSPSPRAS